MKVKIEKFKRLWIDELTLEGVLSTYKQYEGENREIGASFLPIGEWIQMERDLAKLSAKPWYEYADDGLTYSCFNTYLGNDSGFRSAENETPVHRQATLSRLDEFKFHDIMHNEDYFKVFEEEPQTRCYFLCLRCGYVPESKMDKENTKYLDLHCKCGNAVQYADITDAEIQQMMNDEFESVRYSNLFKDVDEVLG